MISNLGSGSAFWAAQVEDDEIAEEYLRRHKDEQRPPAVPAMSDMTLTNQLLMQVVDQLKVQGAKLDALGGVKPEPVRPTPRPLTGMERAKARLERLHLEQLTGEVYDAMNKWGEVQ